MLSAGFDGENVLLVMRSSAGDHYTTRMLRPDGHRVDIASDRVLAEGPRALASNGDGFVGIATDADGTTILRFDDDGALLWAKTLIARGRVASIATSGSDFLAIWSDGQTYIDGVRVRADGTVEQEFPIGSEAGGFINVPAVAWSNDHYTVSYVSGFNEDATTGLLRILRVDAVSRSVVQNEIRSVDPACGTTLARFGDRTIGAWCEQPDGTPAIVMRDVATHDPATEIAFGATDQPLARGTSSADATLVVWREVEDQQVALRAGLRQRDGMWSEKQIATDASPQLVASDGNQFLVVTRNDKTPAFSAIVLSAGLGVIARVATLPFEPLAVAPNGRGYAILGIDNHDLYGVEVSTSGIMSAPVLLREHPQNGSVVHAALAFDGTSLCAVWQVSVAAFAGSLHSTLEATRLTPSLARISAQDAILADDAENPAVAWDGSAFAVAWLTADDVLHLARYTPEGVKIDGPWSAHVSIANDSDPLVAVRPANGTLAVIADRDIAVLDGAQLTLLPPFANADTRLDDLVTLPDGRYGVLTTQFRRDAPHHGAARVMLTIAAVTPLPGVPDPPTVSASYRGGILHVSWTASPPPVNGYRVEYRVDDRPWNELEGWFGPNERFASVRPQFPGAHTYSLRVRAVNDGGISEPSQEVTVSAVRRRAVH